MPFPDHAIVAAIRVLWKNPDWSPQEDTSVDRSVMKLTRDALNAALDARSHAAENALWIEVHDEPWFGGIGQDQFDQILLYVRTTKKGLVAEIASRYWDGKEGVPVRVQAIGEIKT